MHLQIHYLFFFYEEVSPLNFYPTDHTIHVCSSILNNFKLKITKSFVHSLLPIPNDS